MPGDLPKLRKLGDMGVYFQITAGSIAGKFGKQIQRFAFKLLEEGLCHFAASDAHNPGSRAFFLLRQKVLYKQKNLHLKLLTYCSAKTHPKCLAVNQA